MELGERMGMAVSLASLGAVLARRATRDLEQGAKQSQEQPGPFERAASERAARLFGAVDTLLESSPSVLTNDDRQLYEQSLAAVRSLLNEEAFGRASAEGRAMSLEQAIAYALEE
jgi:hypothetical protein